MSYNVTAVATPVLDAWMYASDVRELDARRRLNDPDEWWAECTFIEDLAVMARADQPNESIPLRNFWWCGEWSGRSIEGVEGSMLPLVISKIHGRVDAIFCWEGGDSFTGLRIVDGVATECEVVMALKEKGTT